MSESKDILGRLAQTVIDGEPEEAEAVAREALDAGLDPLMCINEGLTPGINRVGALFETGEYYLPDLIIGGDAMKAALTVIEPARSAGQGRQILGRVVLGTVEGDLHEIGKTLVGTMLTANGFEVTDIGVDAPAHDFVAAVLESGATVVGASALLTTTMLHQQEVIEALKEAGLRDQVKVIVGGAPVTDTWAAKIGADGYAEDAIGAVVLAKKLVATA